MKTFFLIQIPVQIGLLILAVVVGGFGGFLLAFSAPWHSPRLVEEFLCPPDTTLETGSYESTTSSEPGMRTLTVSCVYADGHSVPALEDNDASMVGMIVRFSTICIGISFCPLSLLTLGLGVWLARRRKPAQPEG
jgi:hypothetical protein